MPSEGRLMTDLLSVPKPYLVVVALYELGGEADLEAIAVKAFEMFPGLFGWKNYPNFPDKDVVRVHLSDAKKDRFGKLVTDQDLREPGDRSKGRTKRYALTRGGVAKAQEIREVAKGKELDAQQTSIPYRRVVEPILKSEAYRRFSHDESLEAVDRESFFSALKLFPDATDFMINGRLARAERIVDSLPEPRKSSLRNFLRKGREAFEI